MAEIATEIKDIAWIGFFNLNNSIPICDFSNTASSCYTDSWYLIGSHLFFFVILLSFLLFVSLLFTTFKLEKKKSIKFIRLMIKRKLISFMCYAIEFVGSFYVCLNWIIRAGSLTVYAYPWFVESVFFGLMIGVYMIQWLVHVNKVQYVLSMYRLFDLVSFASHFAISFHVLNVDGAYKRSWMDFAYLRAYMIYSILGRLSKKFTVSIAAPHVILMTLQLACLIFFAASVLFCLELLGEIPHSFSFLTHAYDCQLTNSTVTVRVNNQDGFDNCKETWSILAAVYFMFVTVSTVGYGDFSTKTVLGRFSICLLIVVGIYVFAENTSRIVTIFQDVESETNLKDIKKRKTKRILIIGNAGAKQVKAFIFGFLAFKAKMEGSLSKQRSRETSSKLRKPWSAVNQNIPSKYHIVILASFTSIAEEKDYYSILEDLHHRIYPHKLEMITGSSLQDDVLHKVLIQKPHAIFCLPDRSSEHTVLGDEADTLNILRVLRISYILPDFKTFFVMLTHAKNRMLLESSIVGISSSNIVCLDELRLGLMGLTCRCEGINAMISNLLSIHELPAAVARYERESPPSKSVVVEEHTINVFDPLYWKKEYTSGAANHIFSCHLHRRYWKKPFYLIAQQIHEETNGRIVIFAIDDQDGTIFSPSSEKIKITEYSRCYCITDDVDYLSTICSIHPSLGIRSGSGGYHGSYLTFSKPRVLYFILKYRSALIAKARRAQHRVNRRLSQQVRRDICNRFVAVNVESIPNGYPTEKTLTEPHIILCSDIKNFPSSLLYFVRPLRAIHAECPLPIVIIDPNELPLKLWTELKKLGEIYHIRGSVESYTTVLEAGLLHASTVVILAQKTVIGNNDENGSGHMYQDSSVIFNTVLIQSIKRHNPKLKVLLELTNIANHQYLNYIDSTNFKVIEPHYTSKTPRRTTKQPLRQTTIEQRDGLHFILNATYRGAQEFWRERLLTTYKECKKLLATALQKSIEKDDGEEEETEETTNEDDVFYEEKFIEGSLFPSFIGERLLIQAYHNPAINDVVRNILRAENSCLMLYEIPERFKVKLDNQTLVYSDLYDFILTCSSHSIPIGLFRAPSKFNGSNVPYVYTCPLRSTRIFPNDRIYVMMNAQVIDNAARRIQQKLRPYVHVIEAATEFGSTLTYKQL